mgnify:CR=1 FL=1
MIVARQRAKGQMKRLLIESRVLDRNQTYDLRNADLLIDRSIQLKLKEILVSLVA